VALFSPLKRTYGRDVEKLMRVSLTHIAKEDFFPAFKDTFPKVFTDENILSGFRRAGIVPQDPEKVISQLDVKIRTPKPEIGFELMEPWVSQTPQNPTQAQSQFTFLKDRISRHQNSSPKPILSAVDQITKRAKMTMHNKYALLEAEVKLLRNANKELSKRRRTKKKICGKEYHLVFEMNRTFGTVKR
jgi:hypothetical protein